MKMTEENKTQDRGCYKCRHDVNSCKRRPCNIANNYDLFEPKGAETETTGCNTCPNWKAVKIGAFCPDCGEKLQ